MAMDRARELLDLVLEGEEVTAAQVDALIGFRESLWLDFKSGRVLDNKNHARDMIREYVSAFANSDGGLLVIGVEDRMVEATADGRSRRKVDGCRTIEGLAVNDWARACHSIARTIVLNSTAF